MDSIAVAALMQEVIHYDDDIIGSKYINFEIQILELGDRI